MPQKTGPERRLKFFNLGITHCPICLVPFTEDNVRIGQGVTLEHAPPRNVGGSVVCLTCEPCNHLASGTLDQAVARSRRPPEVELDISGIKRTSRFWDEGIPPSKMPYGFGSVPSAQKARRELREETIVAISGPITIDQPTTIRTVSISPKLPDSRHLELSYLRSAYLLVFSLLGGNGYMYAQSEAVRPIRTQIMNPHDKIIPSLVRVFTSERSPENMITLRNNGKPFFWSVRFDDGTCVFLPHGGSENHFRQIAELPEEQAICGWEWTPRKFGNAHVDLRLPPRYSKSGENNLFGQEFTTVSNDGCKQRWIVVNQVGDGLAAMRAGP